MRLIFCSHPPGCFLGLLGCPLLRPRVQSCARRCASGCAILKNTNESENLRFVYDFTGSKTLNGFYKCKAPLIGLYVHICTSGALQYERVMVCMVRTII